MPSDSTPDRRVQPGAASATALPARRTETAEPCEVCGSDRLTWRSCKLICGNCRSIVKSCADL